MIEIAVALAVILPLAGLTVLGAWLLVRWMRRRRWRLGA